MNDRLLCLLALLLFNSTIFAADCAGKAFIELTNRSSKTLYCGKDLAVMGGLDAIKYQPANSDTLKSGQTLRLGFYSSENGRSGSVSCSGIDKKSLKDAVITVIVTLDGNCQGGKYSYTVSAQNGYRTTYASCLGSDYQEAINPLRGERNIFRTLAVSLFSELS